MTDSSHNSDDSDDSEDSEDSEDSDGGHGGIFGPGANIYGRKFIFKFSTFGT